MSSEYEQNESTYAEESTNESSLDFNYAQGMGLIRAKNYANASEFFTQIIQEDVHDPRGYWGMLLVTTKCLTEPSPEAEEWYNKALKWSHPAVKRDIEKQYSAYKTRVAENYVAAAESIPVKPVPEETESTRKTDTKKDFSDFEKILSERKIKEEENSARRQQEAATKMRAAQKKQNDLKKLIIAAIAVIIAIVLLIVVITSLGGEEPPDEPDIPPVEDNTEDDVQEPSVPVVHMPDYDVSDLTVKPQEFLDEEVAYTVTANSGLNMRKGPAVSHEFIVLVPHGTSVKVVAESATWKLCVYGEYIGWCSAEYLQLT